jgi:hypothetical protein
MLVARVLAAILAIALVTPLGAGAAGASFLSGTVTVNGRPAAGISVTATGANTSLQTKTDSRGRFSFGNLAVGRYTVTAARSSGKVTEEVDVGGYGANVALEFSPNVIANVVVSSQQPLVRGSGTDLMLSSLQLSRSPAAGSLPDLLVQLPGAARGANGVVHLNGDHGDINYIVDGVAVPQELNRIIGTEIDPSDIAFIDVMEGAYPAQYGERFAAVLSVDTNTGTGPAAATLDLSGGSYNDDDSTLGYHTPLGKGRLVMSSRSRRSTRALDPPNFDSPHDNGSDTNQFLRYTVPLGDDVFNVTAIHSYQTFQVPNDVANGEPSATDDSQTQADWFLATQYRHAIGSRGSLSFGPAYKQSRIRDFGDPANDFLFGRALNLAAGGAPTCAYSLSGDRTARDYRFNVDYALRSAHHEIRSGAVYDLTNVAKDYAVTLQPGNFLAPIFSPLTPNAAYTVVDDAPNVGHTEEAYIQDTWRMGGAWQLDYGVRFDAFQVFSSQFADGASQFSPRIKMTRFFGPRASLYAYYGRFFTPFSFENVSPYAAYLLDLPLQPAPAAFDLKPQRDSDYELGGHLPLGGGDLGMRVMQKNAADLIDDTQVGVTNLHQDINYQLGRIAVQALEYRKPLALQGQYYLTGNHTYSVNKGCETQLLAPCFGSPTDWTPADHEQRWGATSGLLVNDRHGGWLAVDAEYGSGLSSTACPRATPGFCKYTPHLTFDVLKGIALTASAALTMRIGNILGDRYLITYQNAQGNHYAAGRTFDVGVRFGAGEPKP